MADLTFDIGAKYREASSAFKELAGDVDKFQRKLKDLDRAKANPEVDLVLKEAQRDLTKFKAELDNLKNVKLQVDAEVAKANADIRSVERELKQLKDADASVEVIARTKIAETRLKQLTAERDKLKDVRLNVIAEIAQANANVSGLNSNIGRLERDITTRLTVEADTSTAGRDVGAFATQMRSRLTAAINALPEVQLTAESSDVDREMAAIRAELATLLDPTITPNFNDAGVRAQIAALSAQLQAVSAQDVDIEANFNATAALAQMAVLRRTMGDTGQQGSVLFRILGGGVSALGSLVGASTRAGSAMTSLGTSIGRVGGGAAEAGSAFGGMSRGGIMLAANLAALAVSLPLIAGGIGLAVAAVGQLGGAFIALASGIVPLVGNLGLLPGLLLPIGLAAGAVAIAFGDEGLKREIEGLSAAFQPLVNDIRNQLRPALTGLLQSVAQLVPTFRAAAPAITSAISDVSAQFSTMFQSSSFRDDLRSILTSAGQTIRDFGSAAQSGLRGFMDMMIAAQPVVDQFSLYIRNVADEFANMMAEGRRTGKLTTFFSQALSVFQQVMGVVRNLGGLFKDLWDSANRTGAFQATLGAINDGITRFRDYVSQVGGAWDQLMSKAGTITGQVIDLIATIGDAFVQIANKVDLGPAIDGIKGLVRGLIPFFQETGQAMSEAIGAVGPVLGRAFEQWGPSAGDAIRKIGLAIIEIVNAIDELGTRAHAAGLRIQGMWQLITGDIAGAKASFAEANQLLVDLDTRLGANQTSADALAAGLRGAGGAAKELAGNIGAVPTDLQIAIDADPAAAVAKKDALLATVNASGGLINIDGNPVAAGTALQQVINAINAGRGDVEIGGETYPVDEALRIVVTGINETHGDVTIGGQTYPAGEVLTALMAHIGAQRGDVTVGGNPAPGHAAVGEVVNNANTARGTATIDANPGPAQGVLQGFMAAVFGARPGTSIDADTGPAQSAFDRFAAGVRRPITTVINVVRNFLNAEGGIVAPMASGGLLPMAEGDTLDRLRPMSGRTAQIVPPNTWRVIGDRQVDDEAFIPINDSSWSTAILGETARRKGFALMPMATGGMVVAEDWGHTNQDVPNVEGRRAAARAGRLAPGTVVYEDDPRWFTNQNWANPEKHIRPGSSSSTIGFSLTAMGHGGVNETGMDVYRRRKAVFDKHRREWARTHPGQENTNTTVRQFWPEYADAVARGFRGTVQQFYSQYQPSGRSGGHGSRDEQAWEWVRKLLEGIRGRPGGGGGSGIPSGGVGGAPGPAPVGRLQQPMLQTTFATAGGMASMTRANPLYAPMPYRPFAPDPGRSGRSDLSNISFGPTGSRWLDDLLEEVANKIRSRGGDSRILYSRR